MTSRTLALASSFLPATLSVSVLLGWAFGITALKTVFPSLVTMKANTATTMLLCGVALASG
jgi:hypothetical protein